MLLKKEQYSIVYYLFIYFKILKTSIFIYICYLHHRNDAEKQKQQLSNNNEVREVLKEEVLSKPLTTHPKSSWKEVLNTNQKIVANIHKKEEEEFIDMVKTKWKGLVSDSSAEAHE